MKKINSKRIALVLIVVAILLTLFQTISLATNEHEQLIKKGEKEYLIYISNLVDQKFQFAFSNDKNSKKNELNYIESALDKVENGNNIAYIDSNIYNNFFNENKKVFMWVKDSSKYLIEGEQIDIKNALTESLIGEVNNFTKKIQVEIGEKVLPLEKDDQGNEYNKKIGTLVIKDNADAQYSYILMHSTPGSEVEEFIKLVDEANKLDKQNMYEKLKIYNNLNSLYNELEPQANSENWKKVNDSVIEEPIESKKDDQYLVWIKQDVNKDESNIDVKVMTCLENEKENTEKRTEQIKEVVKLPITGDSIVLFVVAGVIILLIILLTTLKLKNGKKDKDNN